MGVSSSIPVKSWLACIMLEINYIQNAVVAIHGPHSVVRSGN